MPLRRQLCKVARKSAWLPLLALLVPLTACFGKTTGEPASTDMSGAAGSSGAAGTAPNGVVWGGQLAQAGGGTGGDGSYLDTSEAAGPCGQYVYDLAAKCHDTEPGTICVLDSGQWPDCTRSYVLLQPEKPSIRSGCGYIFTSYPAGEGEVVTAIHQQSNKQLVFYSSTGARGIGCMPRGMRVGQMPAPCAELKDECIGSAAAGVGGTDG